MSNPGSVALPSTPVPCSPTGQAGPQPPGSQSITGTVTDGSTGLEGISVYLGSTAGGQTETTTNPLGEFAFTDLGNSDYIVSFFDPTGSFRSGFYAGGPTPVLARADATLIPLAGGGASGIDAELDTDTTHSISGSVSDFGGSLVPGAFVEARGAHFGGLVSCVIADDGTFEATDVRSGVYRINVTADGYPHGFYAAGALGNFTTHFSEASLVTVDTDLSAIDIAYPELFNLEGIVLDGADVPKEGFFVSAVEAGGGATGFDQSDGTGQFTIGGLPAGEYQVYYSDGNGLHRDGWFAGDGIRSPDEAGALAVTVPQLDPPIELLAELAPTITGRIIDDQGAGVAFAGLSICDELQEACANSPGTDSDGYFTAAVFTPADYYMLVFPDPAVLPSGGYYTGTGGTVDPDLSSAAAISAGVTDVTGVNAVVPAGGRIEAQVTSGGSHVDFPYVSFCRAEFTCPDQSFEYDAEFDALSPVTFAGTYYVFVDLDFDGNGHWLVDGGTASTDFADATPIVVTANNLTVIASDVPVAGVDTPVGNPEIDLDDGTGTIIEMAFLNVDVPGTTSVTVSDTGAAPPDGFQLGVPPTYYDFTTTAEFDEVTICIPYGSNWISEANLRLFHYDESIPGWEDITILPVNTVDHIICGVTDSLSPFVLAEPEMSFTGFFQPVDDGALNKVRAGAGVPVRFSLGGDFGLEIFVDGSPSVSLVSCATSAVDTIEQTVAVGSSHLVYDAAANQYVYQFKTSKSWAGTCRRLELAFSDGSTQTVDFQLTR